MNVFPRDLIDALNSDQVVCICGSGPSVASGYPTWPQLIALMITECETQLVGFQQGKELRTLLERGHLLEVADECSQLLSGQLYRDFFQRVFRQESIRPGELHELITQLPFSAVLTTNYDNLLERAYVTKSRFQNYPFIYTQKNLAQLPQLASDKRFFIFKIHGDADDIQTVVMTKRDYRDIIHNNDRYRTALLQILQSRTALFLGYGMRDYDLNLILEEQAALFKGYGRRHFAFLADPGTILPKSFLQNYNLTVIPYSGRNNHEDLPKLLHSLVRLVKKSPALQGDPEKRRLSQLMDIERDYSLKLGTYIELNRARFLKIHAWDLLEPNDCELIENSIKYWEEQKSQQVGLQHQLLQAQKMESVGQLAAGVAHDFNNILTVIQGHSGLLMSLPELSPAMKTSLQEVSLAAQRAANLTRQLLTFSRRQIMEPKNLDLNDLVNNMAVMIRRLLTETIDLRTEFAPHLPRITCDGGMVEQVVVNLVVNARDAMPRGGALIIQTKAEVVGNDYLIGHPNAHVGSFAVLSVSDTGCGISPNIIGRIFEPFFTTKDIGKGTGLGLSTVFGIAEQHGGWVEVESKVGVGSTFRMFLPESKQIVEPPTAIPNPKDLRGTETILLVEDEPALIKMESQILRSNGYSVIPALSGREAIGLWKQNKQTIQLLVTDMIMPEGVSGYELSILLLKEKPSLRVLYVSGYSSEVANIEALSLKDNFLSKPFSPTTLLLAIRALLDTGNKGS